MTNTWSPNGALAISTTPTGTQTYTTDLTDELISLTLEDGSTVGYTQDASGNRTSRTVNGLLDATWAWDDLSSLPMRVGEYDPAGALTTGWLPDPTSSPGASLAQTSSGVNSWLLSDPFANTVATVSTTGNTVSGTKSMDAFGVQRTTATGSLASASVGFAGQHLDTATGLYDMRARDYDPTSGRFTATDPVAIPTGMPYVAGYSYAFNNPLMFSDPTGRTAIGQDDYADGGSYRPANSGKYWPAPTNYGPETSACSQDEGRFPYTHASNNYRPENFATDAQFGEYLWQQLRAEPSAWSHWNDQSNLSIEYAAMDYGYKHGGHTYTGGPICGGYAVCITGVSWVTSDTAITFGRVILTSEESILPWRQFHEYAHVIDYVDVGVDRFKSDYAGAKLTASLHRGGARSDDGNWMEKSANARADAAFSAWTEGGVSSVASPQLLSLSVRDAYCKSSYTDLCGG